MFGRQQHKIALAVLTAVACSGAERRSANDTSGPLAPADTSRVTTYEMSQTLARDVRESDRELTAFEDSIYVFMGDSIAVLMKRAHASWAEHRQLECAAIRLAFAEGTMAPAAHLECWIELTDDHRRFLTDQYGYMRNGRPTPGARTR